MARALHALLAFPHVHPIVKNWKSTEWPVPRNEFVEMLNFPKYAVCIVNSYPRGPNSVSLYDQRLSRHKVVEIRKCTE